MKLPVSVIIPTLDCRDKLEKHLDAIGDWLPEVAEIIAIDSNSTDGTRELLENSIIPLGGRVINAQRGLYQCWNQAASLATQPYLYYSTICDIISLKGLKEMVRLVQENKLDVIISKPKIVSENKEALDEIKWPIHYISSELEYIDGLSILRERQLAILLSIFVPATLLGSSASNIYRTDAIQRCPFPLEVGNVGDSLWALRYLPRMKVGITNCEHATFCWDGCRDISWDNQSDHAKIFQREVNKIMDKYEFINIEKIYLNYLKDQQEKNHFIFMEYENYIKFLTRPFRVKAKEKILQYTSVRYWLERLLKHG